MSRPLLVTDCDEVLLHMVSHFAAWLGESHDVDFDYAQGRFGEAMTRRSTGAAVDLMEVWPLLDGFFADEMHRQTVAPGAIDALARIGAVADIVVLTNLKDECHAGRVAQLSAHGIDHRVVCNQGGKGTPLGRLVAEYAPTATVFVDDLPQHHESVARHVPAAWRLHMIADQHVAAGVPAAPDAHARIDDWAIAADWILARMADGPAA